MPQSDILEPADMMVMTAIVDGELTCATDDDGAAEIYEPRDPEMAELVEAAREEFGPSACAISIREFRELASTMQGAASRRTQPRLGDPRAGLPVLGGQRSRPWTVAGRAFPGRRGPWDGFSRSPVLD